VDLGLNQEIEENKDYITQINEINTFLANAKKHIK
jgi:hypothetical protein